MRASDLIKREEEGGFFFFFREKANIWVKPGVDKDRYSKMYWRKR